MGFTRTNNHGGQEASVGVDTGGKIAISLFHQQSYTVEPAERVIVPSPWGSFLTCIAVYIDPVAQEINFPLERTVGGKGEYEKNNWLSVPSTVGLLHSVLCFAVHFYVGFMKYSIHSNARLGSPLGMLSKKRGAFYVCISYNYAH